MNNRIEQTKPKLARFYDERVEDWREHHNSPHDFWYRGNSFGSQLLSKFLFAGSKCLEIGCAAGQFSELLHRQGHVVFGVDISPGMVEASRRRLSALGLSESHFRCCDANSLPFDDSSFDLVVALGVLPYIENQPRFLKEIHRVLKPAGFVFVSNITPGSLYVKILLIKTFPQAFGGKYFIPGPWWWRGVYNYIRTGISSGGLVDLSKAIQARSADMLDRMLVKAGFSIVDRFDMYNLRRLDHHPFDRKGFSRWAARRWAWNHFGLYRKSLSNTSQ